MSRKISIADLLTATAALAVSFGSVRLYWQLASSPALPLPDRPYDYFMASACFLAPPAWASTGLAMARTPRERWASHPAIVVGTAVATVLLIQIALSPTKYSGTPDWTVWIEAVVESWQEGVTDVLVAAFVIAVVCGKLRRPGDGLEVAGMILAVLWVAAAAGTQALIYFI